MGAIQIKNVPEELHMIIRKRAAAQGMGVSDYVLNLIREDAAVPTQEEWIAMVKADGPLVDHEVDVLKYLDEGRAEWDEEIDGTLRRD